MSKKTLIKEIISFLVLAIIFVAVSFFASQHKDQLAGVVGAGGILGIFGFIILTAIFVIFVIPLDIAFLIPLGAHIWGPIPTAGMSIAGWVLGSAVAFGAARRFGAPLVEKLIGLDRIRVIEKRMPKRDLFLSVIALRLLVSVDILSYALGLFSRMGWGSYILATAIGVTPFGFYFAYTSILPFWYQIAAIGAAVLLASVIVVRYGIQREP